MGRGATPSHHLALHMWGVPSPSCRSASVVPLCFRCVASRCCRASVTRAAPCGCGDQPVRELGSTPPDSEVTTLGATGSAGRHPVPSKRGGDRAPGAQGRATCWQVQLEEVGGALCTYCGVDFLQIEGSRTDL